MVEDDCKHEWEVEEQFNEDAILCVCKNCGIEKNFIVDED